jgi:hypothetical protein
MSATEQGRFWKRHARRYDRATLVLNRRFPEMAALVAERLRGCDVVVEVAAGTGLVTLPLASSVGRVLATDLSPEMLAILQPRVADRGFANVAVQRCNALHLPFRERVADAIVAANTCFTSCRRLARSSPSFDVSCAPGDSSRCPRSSMGRRSWRTPPPVFSGSPGSQ